MRRFTTVRTSSRSSYVDLPSDEAWAVVASGAAGRQWYVDAAPVVFRGTLDRLLGGAPSSPLPGTALLQEGDRAGFWRVDRADHDGPTRELLLTAEVRAPGVVDLRTTVTTRGARSQVKQTIRLRPSGVLGAAYLAVDLPAREAFTELLHRRLLADLATAARQPR